MDASMLYNLNMLPLAYTSLGLVDNFTSSMWPEESLFLSGGDGLPTSNLDRALGLITSISARAFADGLKIVLIGWFLELFNSVPSVLAFLYRCMIRPLYLEVSFSSRDICYDWIMLWLSKQPSWAMARDLQVSDYYFGVKASSLVGGSYSPKDDFAIRSLTYLPVQSDFRDGARIYTVWFKRHYIKIRPSDLAVLHISIFLPRSHSILLDLIREAREKYLLHLADRTSVYEVSGLGGANASDSDGWWEMVSSSPKRSIDSVILDPAVKDSLLKDAKKFVCNREWYMQRGIPFRRGYLLHGAPGTGKTSFISALAGELGLEIFVVSLTQKGMTDAALKKLFNRLPERCIALIEDIDAALTSVLNRDHRVIDQAAELQRGASMGSSVTLSGLLNALDGVGAQEGRILFATTNKVDSLDKALCRPGRMDVWVEFKLATKYQARELFKWFYKPKRATSDECNADEHELSEKDTSSDSCTSSESQSPSLPSSITLLGDAHEDTDFQISDHLLQKLAHLFAEAIPEEKVSMAALQGYLMEYKISPAVAVGRVSAWLEKEFPVGEVGTNNQGYFQVGGQVGVLEGREDLANVRQDAAVGIVESPLVPQA